MKQSGMRAWLNPRNACVAVVLFMAANGVADDCPYADLKTNSSVRTALGTWVLQAWSARMDFPRMQDKADVRQLRPAVWGMPVKCDASVTVTSGSLSWRVAGYQRDPEADGWIPMVAFSPRVAGTYGLSGDLKIWFDGDTNATDSVQWAVVAVKDGPNLKPLAGDKVGHGTVVKLSEQAALKAIDLGVGDSVGLMVWRPAHRHVCGGVLKRFSVSKATAAEQGSK